VLKCFFLEFTIIAIIALYCYTSCCCYLYIWKMASSVSSNCSSASSIIRYDGLYSRAPKDDK